MLSRLKNPVVGFQLSAVSLTLSLSFLLVSMKYGSVLAGTLAFTFAVAWIVIVTVHVKEHGSSFNGGEWP